MIKIKQSLIALLGVFAVVSLTALLTPSLTQGQGQGQGNQSALNVNVLNTPLAVRDVENPARQPFNTAKQVSFFFDVDSLFVPFGEPLPSDKQAVLEYVTAECRVPSGQRPSIQITQVVPGPISATDIANPILTYQATVPFGPAATHDIYHSSDPLRLYPAPGSQIYLKATRNPATGIGLCTVYVSGYLVSMS
jgi:hypothetical protein